MSIFQFSIFHNMNINHSSVRIGTEKRKMRARIFNIMQYQNHPNTGEMLLSEDAIKSAVEHKGIDKWAYVLHNQDIHTQQECDRYIKDHNGEQPEWKVGDKKPPHWHVVIQFKNQSDTSTVAKWLGITENYVQVPKGNGPGKFLDCVAYLTHENKKQQSQGKHLYSDEEIHSNFDFRSELNQRADDKVKYGGDLSPKDKLRYDVLYRGKTLRQCISEAPKLYMDDMQYLKKARLDYISRQPAPPNRINYYVTGEGGDGKGLMCRSIARSLFPNDYDDEIFFEVGSDNCLFEGYDGQPVIIWNDFRAHELIESLGSIGNVYTVFDTHPTRQKQNIKYGSINLCNTVNLINSVQPWSEFLDELNFNKEDRKHKQAYRRFPLISVLHTSDYDLLINKGFIEGDSESFGQYIEYKHIQGSLRMIAERCRANDELARELEAKTVKPVITAHNQLVTKMEEIPDDEDEIRAEFANYGTIMDTTVDTVENGVL